MACTCKVGPGRFEAEGVLTFLAHEAAGNGCADDSAGRYDFFKAPFEFDTVDAIHAAVEYGYCVDCLDDYDSGDVYGCAVWLTDQGFAECVTFATAEEYDAALAEAEAEDCEDNDESEAG